MKNDEILSSNSFFAVFKMQALLFILHQYILLLQYVLPLMHSYQMTCRENTMMAFDKDVLQCFSMHDRRKTGYTSAITVAVRKLPD